MKSIIATLKKTQHERLQDEYIEHRRYGEHGDTCDGNYCNQCPYLKTDDCNKDNCMNRAMNT